jgi:hypothetical protein
MARSQRMCHRFHRSYVIALATLIAVSFLCSTDSPWCAAVVMSQVDLSELPLTFPVQSPEVAAYFNQIARTQDIASFPLRVVHLMPMVTVGQKMVVFLSWADAERELEAWIDQADMVMYNPEHWEHTPADEKENLPATVQQAAEFAHMHGIQFMFAPDRLFAEMHLGEVAPYVDAVLLQGQRLQDNPSVFSSWIRPMISAARAGNPEIRIYIQVRATQGTASQMLAAIESVSDDIDDIDGIAVWSMPRSLDVLQEFVSLIRERQPVAQTTSTSTPTMVSATATPIRFIAATFTPDETIVETHNPPTPMPTDEAQPTTVLAASEPQLSLMKQETQAGIGMKEFVLIGVSLVVGFLLGIGLTKIRRNE